MGLFMEFMDKVTITKDGCYEWQMSCNSAGYAQKIIDGKYWSVHRYVYSLKDPSLLSTELVRHLCHNRKCINPSHLAKGSYEDNWNDSRDLHLEKAMCRRGRWSICGIEYGTVREASAATGVTQGTICKYTRDGVFDVVAYRDGCAVARVKPKL